MCKGRVQELLVLVMTTTGSLDAALTMLWVLATKKVARISATEKKECITRHCWED